MTHAEEMSRLMPYLRQRSPLPDHEAKLIRELLETMDHGVAHFSFSKNDGSIRHAYGTRLPSILEKYVKGKKEENNRPAQGTVPFFDIEKEEWRCFRAGSLKKIYDDYTL